MKRITDLALGIAALSLVGLVLASSWEGADLRDTISIIAAALVALLAAVAHFLPDSFWDSEREFDPWLVRAVAVYRGMGFFRNREDLSDAGLASLMNARMDGEYGKKKIRRWKSDGDLILLRQDSGRCWQADPEEDIARAGSNWYRQTFAALARISEGAFDPSEPDGVQEEWETPRGPAVVRVRTDAGEAEFRPRISREEPDLEGALRFLNRLIAGRSGENADRRFYLSPGREALVVCLRPDERELLEIERNLRLEELL